MLDFLDSYDKNFHVKEQNIKKLATIKMYDTKTKIYKDHLDF